MPAVELAKLNRSFIGRFLFRFVARFAWPLP